MFVIFHCELDNCQDIVFVMNLFAGNLSFFVYVRDL